MNQLQVIAHLVNNRSIQLLEQMQEVNATLNEAQIVPVWLKGAALLTEHDGNNKPRMMSDLDLWIPNKENQQIALTALCRIGYSPKPEALQSDWSQSHHYAPLYHPERPVPLELHRHVVRKAIHDLLPDNLAESRLDFTTLSGMPSARLALTDRIMHSLIQCSLMSTPPIETGQIRLMKVMDLVRLLEREGAKPIFAQIVSLISKSRWRPPIKRFLTLLERDFCVTNPLGTDLAYCRAVDHFLLHGSFAPQVLIKQMVRPPGDWRAFLSEPRNWGNKILNRWRSVRASGRRK